VQTRAVDANDGSGPHTWTYSYSGFGLSLTPTTTVVDPAGNYAVHTFNAFRGCTLLEKQTQAFDASGAVLRTVSTDYDYNTSDLSSDYVGLRPTQITTTLPNGKTSKVVRGYDSGFSYYNDIATVPNYQSVSYGKVISESEYDYGASVPTRTTKTEYSALNNPNYLNNNLMNQVWTTEVLDGNGNRVAYSYNDYDGTVLQPSGVSTQRDPNPAPANPYRGNLTATHHWLNTSNGFITTNISYYDTGKVYQTTDPLGHTTTFSYDPTAFAGAYPTTVTDALNHSASTSYDYNTGVKLSTTDVNLRETDYSYDNMLRIKTVSGPADPLNGNQRSQATYNYSDTAPTPSLEVKTTINTSGSLTDSVAQFDGLGRLTRTAKVNGEATPNNWDQAEICYDPNGRKSFSSYPYQGTGVGSTTHFCSGLGDMFSYDGLSRPKLVTHSDGTSAATNYSGAAVQVIDEGNGNTQVQRISQTDALGRLTSVCEVSGSTLQSVTGSDGVPGACNQDISATGFLTSYSYDALGNLISVTQGGLNPRWFTYDSLSRLLTSYNPEAGGTSYTYNNDGTVQTRTRPAPNTPANSSATVTTTYGYDPLKRLLNVSYSDGSTPNVALAYDQTAAYGITTGLTNTIGRKSSEQVTDSQTGAILSASVYSYDVMGRPIYNGQCTVQSCASGASGFYPLNYGYDLAGDMISSTNGMGVSFQSTYNAGERLAKMTSSLSDTNHPGTLLSGVIYNAFAAPTKLSLGNGAAESLGYYPRGWLQSVSTIGPNPAANTPGTGSVNFSGAEQTAQVPNTAGTGSVTINGHEEKFPYPDGCIPRNCSWTYDSGTVTVTVNGGSYSVNYGQGDSAYSVATGLANALNAGGVVSASASYVTGNEYVIYLTAQQPGAGSNYSLSLSAVTNDSYDFGLGSFGTSTTSGSSLTGGSNTTVYDTGMVTVTVAIAGTTTQTSKSYNYSSGDTPSSIASGLASQFQCNSGSLAGATALGSTLSLTSCTSGATTNYNLSASAATTNTTYFSQPSFVGTRSGATLTGGANGQGTLYSLALTYAPDGSIQTSNDYVNGSWSYGYDDFNRLISSNKNNGAQTFTYNYDRYGNRWRQNAPQGGAAPQYTFDANNRIVGSGITYDAAGNVTNDGLGHTFTYDAENRIVSVNGGAATYVYDAEGNRVRKTGAWTLDYLHDLAGHVLVELHNGTWTRGEVFAGGHLANYSAGTTYFVHADWLGSERVRSRVSGLACETITNLPFGDAQNMSFTNGCTGDVSPLHFTGKESDPESGLDDFPARYYSPIAGRWMSPDWAANAVAVPYANFGKPQSLNLYAYVGNDPVDGEDPDGHQDGAPDMYKSLQQSADAAEKAYEDQINKVQEQSNDAKNGEPDPTNLADSSAPQPQPLVNINAGDVQAKTIEAANDGLDFATDIENWIEPTGGGAVIKDGLQGNYKSAAVGAVFVMMGLGKEEQATSQIHHIASNKAIKSGFTAKFEKIFARAGMTLEDDANKIAVPGHAGRHAVEYHEYVLKRVTAATEGKSGTAAAVSLTDVLKELGREILENPGMLKGMF
jgi:RHS repeat-associated protein